MISIDFHEYSLHRCLLDMLDLKKQFNRDLILLLFVVAISLAVSAYLSWGLFTEAWNRNGLLKGAYQVGASLFGGPTLFNAAILGGIAGVLLVWILDTYKQLQVPIPITVLGAITFFSGFTPSAFLENDVFIKGVIASVTAGLVLYIGGINLLALFGTNKIMDSEPRNFRRVPLGVFIGMSGLIGIALIDVYGGGLLSGQVHYSRLSRDIISSGVVVVILGWITVYDNQIRVIQIGPGKSGKTSAIGGIYSDIKTSNRIKNSEAREIDENRLEKISNDINNRHKFPEWTGGEQELYFSYFNRGRIFRKRNTIAALDYPGEKLVGERGNRGFKDRLESYKERHVREGSALSVPIQLVSKLFFRTNGEEWIQSEGDQDQIGRVLYTADVLIFTIPLDDFLKFPIKHSEAPPEYADVAEIERLESDSEYEIKYPSGENVRVREATEEEPGDYYEIDTENQFTDFYFEFDSLPKISDDERYSVTKERKPKEEYIDEYGKIVKELESVDDREIIWTVTMTDLHNSNQAELDDEVDESRGRTDIQRSNLFKDVYREECEKQEQNDTDDSKRDKFLKNKGWFVGSINPTNDRQGYKLLSLWVKNKYLFSESNQIENVMKRTKENYVYPVWYDVTGRDVDGELEIASEGGQILKCSNHIVNKIEGRGIEEGTIFEHPDYSAALLLKHQYSPLGRLKVKSPIEMAYEKMNKRFNIMKRNNSSES